MHSADVKHRCINLGIIPALNLASNWRRFPRAAPAPGMAAVRSDHVMILQQQVSGNVWTVHDGNSGGHVTREHSRSIAGYTSLIQAEDHPLTPPAQVKASQTQERSGARQAASCEPKNGRLTVHAT
jgi:hypothetical protein